GSRVVISAPAPMMMRSLPCAKAVPASRRVPTTSANARRLFGLNICTPWVHTGAPRRRSGRTARSALRVPTTRRQGPSEHRRVADAGSLTGIAADTKPRTLRKYPSGAHGAPHIRERITLHRRGTSHMVIQREPTRPNRDGVAPGTPRSGPPRPAAASRADDAARAPSPSELAAQVVHARGVLEAQLGVHAQHGGVARVVAGPQRRRAAADRGSDRPVLERDRDAPPPGPARHRRVPGLPLAGLLLSAHERDADQAVVDRREDDAVGRRVRVLQPALAPGVARERAGVR